MTLRTAFLSLLVVFNLFMLGEQSHFVFADQEFVPFLAESTGDNTNVRAGQSANFEQLYQLKKGEEIVVVGKEFSWYKIQLPIAAKSFVSKKYVQYLGQNAGGITGNRVNIRAGAGIHHTALGQLAKGEQVYIREEFEEWYLIEPVANCYGWVAEKLLAFKSKDISNHYSGLSPKSYIQKELMEEEVVFEVQTKKEVIKDIVEIEEQGIISVIGYVENFENGERDGIYYKIISKGQPICYIQGVNHMLGRFVHHQIAVDGAVNQKLRSKYDHPVISVLKVRLML